MKNIKIRMKLLLGFMITVLLAVIIGIVGVASILGLRNNTMLLNERTSTAIISERLARNVQQQRAIYRGAAFYSMLEMEEEYKNALAELTMADSDYKSLRTALEASLKTNKGRQLLEEIDIAYASYAEGRKNFLELVELSETESDGITAAVNKPAFYANRLVESVANLTDFINDITDEQAAAAANDARLASIVMVSVLIAAVSIAIILSIYTANRISRPLLVMQRALAQVGGSGNLSFPREQLEELRRGGESRDEVGQSLSAFSKLMERLLYIDEELGTVASGDLTSEIELLSSNDAMGNSLKEMLERLNIMFSEINGFVTQVSSASNEVAIGAARLNHYNTEQRASLEKTTELVYDIAQQADTSESLANSAAKSAQDIRTIAQEGRRKMNTLVATVEEMKDASYSIKNVISIIDEIAFNINLLALNAAVEAAHAGSNGRGFAVVADEVRRLAAKSAEAAKASSLLIAANIEKSNMGRAVSQQTADTLKLIISGVEDGTEMFGVIAQQSQDVRAATEQVTIAMKAVNEAVKQNSIISDKSAAASEALSVQTLVLKQMMTQFKLRDASSISQSTDC